jgi:hypothetical protein
MFAQYWLELGIALVPERSEHAILVWKFLSPL